MISDSAYIEIMKNCSKWNSRTMGGRTRSQTAVFDQQTGIMHRPTEHLFRHPSERCRSQNPMQVYAYPPVRWVRSKNIPSAGIEMNYFLKSNPSLKIAISASTEQTQAGGEHSASEQQQPSNTPSRVAAAGGNGAKTYAENDLDLADFELDDIDNNDQSDEEDWGASRKKRKKTGAGAGGSSSSRASRKPAASAATGATAKKEAPSQLQQQQQQADVVPSATPTSSGSGVSNVVTATPTSAEQRPYACQLCGAKYKSRPGLTYHKIHVHQLDSSSETPKSPSTPVSSI